MLINNTIESSKRPGIPGPHRPDLKWFKDALDGKSDVGHVHKKKDIEDFEHNHDGRYYRKDEHELQLLLSGNGTPNFNQGINGDYYVDELNGDLYKKSGDAWNLIIHLEGEQGIPGPQGNPGIRGPEGPTGKEGYTPVRGTDYWTPEDEEIIRQSIVSEVALGLSSKVDKVAGKGLSTEDFTTLLKQKLEELQNYDDRDIRELLEKALYNVTIDVKTGILTFHTIDESTFTVDLPLELIVSDGYLNKDTNTIVLVLANGNTIDIPVENLIKDFYSKSEVDQKIEDLAEEVAINFEDVDEELAKAQAQIDALKAENEAQQKELDVLYNDLVPGEASGETAVVTDGVTGSRVEIDGDGNSYQEIIEAVEGTEISGEHINVTDVDTTLESSISLTTNISQETREAYQLLSTDKANLTIVQGSTAAYLQTDENGFTTAYNQVTDAETELIYTIPTKHIVSGKQYTLGIEYNYSNRADIYLRNSASDSSVKALSSNTASSIKLTNIANSNYMSVSVILKANSSATFRLTLAEGTEQKPWQVYDPDYVMPSIEFPSEIKTPVGKQSIVSANKNLAYNVEYHQNNTTANSYLVKADYKIIEGCYYKISWKCNVDNQFITVNKGEKYGFERINFPNGVVVGKENAVILKAIKSGTFEQIQLLARSTYLFDSSITVFCSDFVLEKIEATNDSEALAQKTFTNYIEHQSQVQDLDVGELLGPIVDKEDGSYFENRYGRYTVTGDEIWRLFENGKRIDLYNLVTNSDMSNNQYCNYIKKCKPYAPEQHTFFVSGDNIRMYNDWNFTNEDEVKAKFKELYANGTPLEFVFPLATPTYTKLTDEQQAQWNKIKAMSLYEGTTNLYTISEEGIAPIIDLNYNYVTPAPSVDRESDIEVVDGVNRLNVHDLSEKAKAVGITVDEEDYISNSSSDSRSWAYENSNWFKKLKAGTYTIYVFVKNKPTSINSLMHIYKNGENTSIGYISYASLQSDVAKVTITLSEDAEIGIMFKIFDGVFKVMLVEGTTEKPYLPYGHIGLVQRGIQLLDFSNIKTGSSSGITVTSNKDGSYNINGTATEGAINVWLFGGYASSGLPTLIQLKKGKSYYIRDAYLFMGTTGIENTQHLGGHIITPSIDVNVTGIRVPQLTLGNTYNETLYPIIAELPEGMTKLEWEPYIEPIVKEIDLAGNSIAKVGDIKDILNIGVDGSVSIEKKTKLYEFKGTEALTCYNAPNIEFDKTNKTAYFSIALPKYGQTNQAVKNNICSNMFINKFNASQLWSTNVDSTNRDVEAIALQSTLRLRIEKTKLIGWSEDLTNAEKQNLMQNYLKALYETRTPMSILYALLNPETIQLPSIEPIELFEGTNIFELVTNLGTTLTAYYKVSSKKQLIENNDRLTALEATVNTLLGGN